MKTEVVAVLSAIATALAACAGPNEVAPGGLATDRVPIDQVPMYGGMDCDANPALRESDQKLIADTEKHFGSREKASVAFADQGFRYYQNNDLPNAMRRFNQAWLIDRENGDAYWGFVSILSDKRQYCEATEQFKTALSKPRIQPSAFADAGYVYIGCSRTYGVGDSAKRNGLIADSERALSEAMKRGASPEYVLDKWARARAGAGNYAGAWEKLAEFRRTVGREPEKIFMDRLAKEMPEPK